MFSGCRNADYLRSGEKPRAVTHVASFAFADNVADVNPMIGHPGPMQVAQCLVYSRKVIHGIGSAAISLLVRVRKSADEFSLSEPSSSTIAYILKPCCVVW